MDAQQSAELAIDAPLIFWSQARIPVRRTDKCVDKLKKMYTEWKSLQKNEYEKKSTTMKKKHDEFTKNLDNLFDISHADAMKMMRNEEDKEFLRNQRMVDPDRCWALTKNLPTKKKIAITKRSGRGMAIETFRSIKTNR